MKGTIARCLEELVTEQFGAAKWKEALKEAGLPEARLYTTMGEVKDTEVVAIMKGISVAASLPMDRLMDTFGEYWSTVYAPAIYGTYFANAKNAREFLLSMDEVHTAMTRSLESARPPHFTYEWQGDKQLIMHYHSERGLVALVAGLVRGVGKYYHEDLKVSTAENTVHVHFLG
jgi:hypothetical protein